nr:hypothetical protein [Actinomycetota bacterium]
VRDYGAGLVVAPDQPAALAAACQTLLDHPAALEQAFLGTERARVALSWDSIAEAHERLYSGLLGRVSAG